MQYFIGYKSLILFLSATVGVPYNEEIVVHSSLNVRNKPQNRQKRQFGPYQWVKFDILFINKQEAYHIFFGIITLTFDNSVSRDSLN